MERNKRNTKQGNHYEMVIVDNCCSLFEFTILSQQKQQQLVIGQGVVLFQVNSISQPLQCTHTHTHIIQLNQK